MASFIDMTPKQLLEEHFDVIDARIRLDLDATIDRDQDKWDKNMRSFIFSSASFFTENYPRFIYECFFLLLFAIASNVFYLYDKDRYIDDDYDFHRQMAQRISKFCKELSQKEWEPIFRRILTTVAEIMDKEAADPYCTLSKSSVLEPFASFSKQYSANENVLAYIRCLHYTLYTILTRYLPLN